MATLSLIFPILVLALAGYLAARTKYLARADCETLSRITFNVIIPCLLFINTSTSTIPEDLGLGFLGAFYGAVLLLYLLSLGAGKLFFGYGPTQQAVFAMGTSYSNTTIVGIPLVLQTLGADALLPLFLIIAVQNLLLFTVGTLAVERQQLELSSLLRTFSNLLRQLISNPLTGSLIAGLIFNLLGLQLWGPLQASISLMSSAAIPLALFVLGTSLHQYRIRGEIRAAVVMSLFKVALLPLLVAASMHIFAVDPLWATTAVLAAAMPCGISAYVFAARYQACQATVAAGSLISTIICIIPVLLVLTWAQP